MRMNLAGRPSALRARQNWLTRRRCASRRRTDRVPLTGEATSHLRERSATRQRSKRSSHWSTQGTGGATGTTGTGGASGTTGTGGAAGTTGTGPGKAIGTPAMSESGALAGAHAGCCRSCTRLRLQAFVAAGYQRRGRNVWAQCQSDPAQPSPSSNYSDVESIKDRHRHRLLHSRSDISHSSDAAEPHAVPKSRLDDRANYQQPNAAHSPRRTAPFPNGDVRHGSTPVRRASVLNLRLTDPRELEPRKILVVVPAGFEPATFRV